MHLIIYFKKDIFNFFKSAFDSKAIDDTKKLNLYKFIIEIVKYFIFILMRESRIFNRDL